MAKYLAGQIFKGKLEYEPVITKYPALKDAIDAELERLELEAQAIQPLQ